MFWKKATLQVPKTEPKPQPKANSALFTPGAAKLLQTSIGRAVDALSIEEMDTILFHAIEGAFADQVRSKEYINIYSERLSKYELDLEGGERYLTTLLQSLLDQIEAIPSPQQAGPRQRTGKVFVVHGHDHVVRDHVCEILRSFSLTPVILADTAGSSQTIIELVERHGSVDHAVCLMTADDVGSANGGSLRPRARQNVVWEIGYFFGLLGRNRVSIVTDEEVELPSNILGLRPIVLSSYASLKERLEADLILAETLA